MKMRFIARSPDCTALIGAALVWVVPPTHAATSDALAPNISSNVPVQHFLFAATTAGVAPPGSATNASNLRRTTRPLPVDSQTKSRAGFMAGAGLVILSLLILAAGLALLRAFRQR